MATKAKPDGSDFSDFHIVQGAVKRLLAASGKATLEELLDEANVKNALPKSPGVAYWLGYLQGAADLSDVTVLQLVDDFQ